MNDWKIYKLGDLVEIKHGFAFKGEFITDIPSKNVLLTPGNFHIGGGFKADKFKYYVGEVNVDYVLNKDDLIVTMTDLSKAGDTLGYVAKVPAHTGITYLHNQRLGLIQFKSDDIDGNFLYWLLRTKSYQQFVLGSATGSTVKHTSPSRIRAFEFKAPKSKSEQKAIANILSSFDKKIEVNRRMNATLEAMARALFKAWFVDFEPVHANKENRPSTSASPEIAKLFPSDFENNIPKGWEDERLTEFFDLIGGGTPKTSKSEYWSGNIPWYAVVDAPTESDVFVIDTEKKITSVGLENSSTKLLRKGVTIISARGTVGKLAITGSEMTMNQSCYATKGKFGDYFNYYIVKTAITELKQKTHGAVFDTITQDTFKSVWQILPNKETISAFEANIGSIMRRIEQNLRENKNLAEMRDSLLPHLISSKLKLSPTDAT